MKSAICMLLIFVTFLTMPYRAIAVAPPDHSVGDMPIQHDPTFRFNSPNRAASRANWTGAHINNVTIPFVDESGRSWRMFVNFNEGNYSLSVTDPAFGTNALMHADQLTPEQSALFLLAAQDLKRIQANDPNDPPRMTPQAWVAIVGIVIGIAGIGLALYINYEQGRVNEAIINQNNLMCQSDVARDFDQFWRDAAEQCLPNPTATPSGQICSNRVASPVDSNPDDCQGPSYNANMCVRQCF